MELVVRALAGGLLVVAFALIGEAVKPKRFAGIFGAAPSVAIASLTVTLATAGTSEAVVASTGMIAGSVGMLAYCIVAVAAVGRFGALLGSAGTWLVWFAGAFGVYAVMPR